MSSLRRVAETAAIIGAVALCVIVAGPGGAVEHLLRPIFGAGLDPAARLRDLALGIPLAIMLVPGLALWAWGPGVRPAGTALTALSTLAITVDLALQGRLSGLVVLLLAALWVLAFYQVGTSRRPPDPARRPAALLLSAPSCALPWLLHGASLVLDQVRSGTDPRGDQAVVVVFALTVVALLVLPVLHVRAFAPAGFAAAIAASLYALVSLRWSSPFTAMPLALAILAVATAVAYVDTVRQLAGDLRPPPHDPAEPDVTASDDLLG